MNMTSVAFVELVKEQQDPTKRSYNQSKLEISYEDWEILCRMVSAVTQDLHVDLLYQWNEMLKRVATQNGHESQINS